MISLYKWQKLSALLMESKEERAAVSDCQVKCSESSENFRGTTFSLRPFVLPLCGSVLQTNLSKPLAPSTVLEITSLLEPK